MSSARGWTLRWKERDEAKRPVGMIDGSGLRADVLCGLSKAEIAKTEIRIGRHTFVLKDLFDITVSKTEGSLTVEGSSRFVRLGARLAGGTLIVDGACGDLVGAGMTGGAIEVQGDAGFGAGAGMAGGTLRVRGNAGDRVGGPLAGAKFGLQGGEIVVHGDVGREAGFAQRRGLIAVAGSARLFAGARMHAGTLFVGSGNLDAPGAGMRRGSIVAPESSAPTLPAFRRDGPVDPVWLRLLATRLRELDVSFSERARAALSGSDVLESWSGDHTELGRGELLIGA